MTQTKNKEKITKEMLLKDSFYTKARLLNRAKPKGTRLKASSKLRDFVLFTTQKALKGKNPSVLTTIWTPSEILAALNIIPVNTETLTTAIAGFDLSDEMLAVAEKNFHSPETCSILRCSTGTAIEGLFPKPIAIIATSHLCDAGAKMHQTAGRIYNCPYYLIDTPQEGGEEAEHYVAKQLEELANNLCELTGQKLDWEKLSRAIQSSNKAREYGIRANELRRAVPSPVRGSEAIGFLNPVGQWFGFPENEKIYQSKARDLKKRVAANFTPLGEEKYRIFWLHVKPYIPTRFFRYLEMERKAAIAYDEVSSIFWPPLDPEKPFLSMARKFLSNPANGSLEAHTQILLDLAEKYKIDGVLHYAHWGCRWNYGRTKIIKDAFQKEGIPVLSLDCDSISKRNFFEDQMINQIDAFLDMLD